MTEAIEQNSKHAKGEFAGRLPPAVRFLMAGAVNTLLSVAIYQAALFVTGHIAAYVIAYVAGMVFAYIVYARHVFNAVLSTKRFVAFVLFYIVSGCAGTLINALLIEQWALHPRMAIFATVIIMLPVNYAGSKWCVRGKVERQP